MKIMICHDGSERAQEAMEKAVELFRPHKPEIIVLTVTEPPADASSHNEEAFEEWEHVKHDELRAACEWVAGHGLNTSCVLATGDPRAMILKAIASKSPDLVVVARRGGGVIAGMVLGSVSAYIIRHAKCPVLVMEPTEK